MERRNKIRFEIHQPILARVIGNGADVPDQTISGTLDNISGSGLRIFTAEPIPAGAAIQIDLPDAMVLAEVRYSVLAEPHPLRPDEKRYAIGLVMQQVLNNMGQLAHMIDGIMGQSRKATPVESK